MAAVFRRARQCQLLISRFEVNGLASSSAFSPCMGMPCASHVSSMSSDMRSNSYAVISGTMLSFAASFAKGGRGSREIKAASRKHTDSDEPPPPEEFDLEPYERMMQKAVDHFSSELNNLHAGRANPGLLAPVTVDSDNGKHLQLQEVATVIARNPQLLVVTAFNEGDLDRVASAIKNSPLQLQARVEGREILVPVPRPTAEMIAKLSKMVHQEAEKAKVSIRSARHKALAVARKAYSALSDTVGAEKDVQRALDTYIGEVDRMQALKDKDLKLNH